jgi:hypothetical protein
MSKSVWRHNANGHTVRRDKGRIEGAFVPLLKDTLACAAWRAMEPTSRLLYIALRARYSFDQRNNGRIYLPTRTAAEEVGVSINTVMRGFRELEHHGFIVKMSDGGLGVDGKGRAPRWRLTELGFMHEPPTKEFMQWKGDPFRDPKNRILTQPLSQSDSTTESLVSQPLNQSKRKVYQ